MSVSTRIAIVAIFMLLPAAVFAQTPTPPSPAPALTPEFDYYAGGRPHPTYEEFFSRITYPYTASAKQRRRIERAARILHVGSTENQVLKLLGKPDFKGVFFHAIVRPHEKQRFVLDEVWTYVHTQEQAPGIYHPGRALNISLSNWTRPRRVSSIEPIDLPSSGSH